jgi:hypothetical protein
MSSARPTIEARILRIQPGRRGAVLLAIFCLALAWRELRRDRRRQRRGLALPRVRP